MELEQVVAFAIKTGISLEEVASVSIQDKARLKARKVGSPSQPSLKFVAAA
jgi:hypothetical protein